MPQPPLITDRDARIQALADRIAEKHGTLLTIPMVAAELHRSEKAMRFAFSSWSCRETPWVRALLAGKIELLSNLVFG